MRIGKYDLLFELASGGMGVVHVARQVGDEGFSRLVVVKRLHRHLSSDPEFRNMIRDEADVASRIHHPNVVPVVDVVTREDETCLVLEYVPSMPLSALLAASRQSGVRLEPAIVSRIVSDVLAGLHAAHEVRDLTSAPLAVVHRDVSPQNVLVGADGSARLTDFGIAKAAVRYARTKSGNLKGKLSYMSPEQLQRKDVDRRADIFAAGAVLYEALTSRRLFDGDDEGAVILSVLMGQPTELVSQGFTAEVEEVVERAIATSAADRFSTAREFQEALERALPPASAHDVARVLAAACGERLDERRRRIQARLEELNTPAFVGRSSVDAGGTPGAPVRFATLSVRRIAGLAIGGVLLGTAGFAVATVAFQGRRDSGGAVSAASAVPLSSHGPTMESSSSAPLGATAASLEPRDAPVIAPNQNHGAAPSAAGSRSRPVPRPPTTTAPLRKNPYR